MNARHPLSIMVSLALGGSLVAACTAQHGDFEGEMRIGLFGNSPTGQTYRLRDAVFVLDGPEGLIGLATELLADDAFEMSEVVETGDYSVVLEDGWRIERAGANGSWQGVIATLLSANPTDATVEPSTTTTVTYTFSIDGQEVPFDDGTLEIVVDFEDGDAPCPDENFDGLCDACGDQEVTAGEECDGPNFDGATCATLGFGSGQLACDAGCSVDTTACDSCGNGIVEAGEECEPPNTIISTGGTCNLLCEQQTLCTSSCQIVQECVC